MFAGYNLFTLEVGRWYSWEMLPGYVNSRYCSPIRIDTVVPLKSGKGLLKLNFYNALYAEGVRGFSKSLKVLQRGGDFLFARLLETGVDKPDRCALISEISLPWLKAFCPKIVIECSLSEELNREQIDTILSRML